MTMMPSHTSSEPSPRLRRPRERQPPQPHVVADPRGEGGGSTQRPAGAARPEQQRHQQQQHAPAAERGLTSEPGQYEGGAGRRVPPYLSTRWSWDSRSGL